MRIAPFTRGWILFAGVLLLALLVCLQAEPSKRKKIVVFVPQKVKHIHHHHVKKVYVKSKPEYVEEIDDHHHHHHRGDGPGSWEQDGYDDGAKVGYSGEQAEPSDQAEQGADPGVITRNGWTALPGKQHTNNYQSRHAHDPPSSGQRHGQEHGLEHRHEHHDEHHQYAGPQRHESRHHDRHGGHYQHPGQQQGHQHRHDRPHPDTDVPDYIRSWVQEGFEKYNAPARNNNVQDEEDDIRVHVQDVEEQDPAKEASQPQRSQTEEPPQQQRHHHHHHQHHRTTSHHHHHPRQHHHHHHRHNARVGMDVTPSVLEWRKR